MDVCGNRFCRRANIGKREIVGNHAAPPVGTELDLGMRHLVHSLFVQINWHRWGNLPFGRLLTSPFCRTGIPFDTFRKTYRMDLQTTPVPWRAGSEASLRGLASVLLYQTISRISASIRSVPCASSLVPSRSCRRPGSGRGGQSGAHPPYR